MRISLVFTLLLLLASTGARGEFAVVVADDSPIDSLEEMEVASIFLAKTNRFPNGDRAMPIELKDNPVRSDFYREVSGKTPSQLNSYWATLVFTGKGKPPRGYRDKQEFVQQLEHLPGAISYLPADQVQPGMKVVFRSD